jgi:hypothetical protein
MRGVTIELLEAVFSMGSVPRCCKQDKSRVWLVLRQSPANKDVNTVVEESTALEAVTRQRVVKI